MKYFAKYLQADKFHWFPKNELKIKAGDMALKPAFQYHDGENRFQPEYHEEVGEDEDTKGFLLLKLFLCTRDIEIGDDNIFNYTKKDECLISYHEGLKFIRMYATGRANLANEKCSMSAPYPFKRQIDLLHGFEGDTFKVMGTISNEIDWVNEYDEFNAEEVRYWPLNDGTQMNYEIKCSNCKKFH